MDRDAGSPLPPSPDTAVPPRAWETVRTTGLVGVAFAAVAAVLGLIAFGLGESPPGEITPATVLNTARLFLVFVGMVTTGAAVSMRPDLWWAWALGSATAGLGVGGLPGHWDSFRLLLAVIAAVAVAGAVLSLLTPPWRLGIVSAALLYHFSGIFMATTSPPASPWLTDQLFSRVYNPYLQFVYLRNAYHFYSPEPGPASILAFLLKTETGTDSETGLKQYKYQWVVVPTRPANVRDPLGLGYYRMLSLTEQAARGSAGLIVSTDLNEKNEMYVRRLNKQNQIPFHPADAQAYQYKLPNSGVVRYVLPSYTSHVILEYVSKEDAAKTTVKVYRLEHLTMRPDRLSKGDPPYHPATYRPYFLGEFNAYGHLVNPRDELLYWLIPIIPRTPGPNDPYKKDYVDYLSIHALDLKSPEDVLKADETAGRVFNWSQLK